MPRLDFFFDIGGGDRVAFFYYFGLDPVHTAPQGDAATPSGAAASPGSATPASPSTTRTRCGWSPGERACECDEWAARCRSVRGPGRAAGGDGHLGARADHADGAAVRGVLATVPGARTVGCLTHPRQDFTHHPRRIVEDLRPAALDELGLAGALTELAAALSVPGGVQVSQQADLPPAPPAAVDVAA